MGFLAHPEILSSPVVLKTGTGWLNSLAKEIFRKKQVKRIRFLIFILGFPLTKDFEFKTDIYQQESNIFGGENEKYFYPSLA